MLIRSLAVAAVALTVAIPPSPADAHRRHGHHSHGGASFGLHFGAPIWPRYYRYRRAPVYHYPAPIYRRPYYPPPVYRAPPVATQPAPTYAPAPVQTYQQAPVQTAPVTTAPAYAPDTSNYVNIGPLDQAQPTQSYSQPVQTYAAPTQTYTQPAQVYTQPSQTYTQPVQTYSDPPLQVVPADSQSIAPYQPAPSYTTPYGAQPVQPQGNYATY